MQRFNDGRDWFFEKRYGMFVHWGIYSLLGVHEQVQWRNRMPKSEYVRLVEQFNPEKFNADEWLDVVEAADMEYICFTTKHHDGFCMWDTAHTRYSIMHTPYGRDILAQLAEACHRRGILLCLYYSCPDWHHPNSINFGRSHELAKPNPGDEPSLVKYIEYVRNQITELCTNYGKISAFFWDIPQGFVVPELNDLLRQLQPGIMINDRGYSPGDYSTPERRVPDGNGFTSPTEACQSVGRMSWGYRIDEDYYSDRFLQASVDQILAMDGNYLLNVGPRPDGTIPAEHADVLRRLGTWFGKVKDAFYGAQPANDLVQTKECLLTRNGNSLFVHFPAAPISTGVVLNPLRTLPKKAVLLNDGRDLDVRVEELPQFFQKDIRDYLHLRGLPVNDFPGEVMVARLDFDDLDAAVV